jgi:hypothetical protein
MVLTPGPARGGVAALVKTRLDVDLGRVASGAKGLEKWIKIARQEFALLVEVGVLCSLFVV